MNKREYYKNDCDLSEDNRIWLITGANMSGKSTFLRQNALIVILTQIGCFVPAKKAKLGIFDKIFSRIGSSDAKEVEYIVVMCEVMLAKK